MLQVVNTDLLGDRLATDNRNRKNLVNQYQSAWYETYYVKRMLLITSTFDYHLQTQQISQNFVLLININ